MYKKREDTQEDREGGNDTRCPTCGDLWDFTEETGSSICGNCNYKMYKTELKLNNNQKYGNKITN